MKHIYLLRPHLMATLFILLFSLVQPKSPIAAGMATIPRRVSLLPQVIETILPQVDILYVYCNGHTTVPNCLKKKKIVAFLASRELGDLGDAGKFFMVSKHSGYFFSIDDDLLYPQDYVEKMIEAVNDYDKKAIITAHGTLIPDNIANYWKGRTWVSGFQYPLSQDTQVHVAGTGVSCFHTEYIKMSLHDFPRKNMSDVWLALKAQKNNIPIICLTKPGNWIRETRDDARNPACLSFCRRDQCSIETRLVQELIPWRFPHVNKKKDASLTK